MRPIPDRLPALIAAATLATACQVTTDGEPARVEVEGTAEGGIPMSLVGPNEAALVVPAIVNGDSVQLVLDTGATLTCLDRSVAERLGLEEWRGAQGIGMGVQGTGRMELVRIDSLTVGHTTAYDLMGCVLDLEQLQMLGADLGGLLGLNALKGFRVVLDFPARVVRLEESGAEEG